MATSFLFSTMYILISILISLTKSSIIPSSIPTTKSAICPHGIHYIDICKNSCSCDPRYGGAIMCSRMTDCDDFSGNCPFGETFTDPLWNGNFMCRCNKDKSQTYECFDMSLHNSYLRSLGLFKE